MPSWAINSTKLSNYIKLNKMAESLNNAENAQLGIGGVSNWLSFPENIPEKYSWVLVTIKSPMDRWVEMAGFDGEKFQLPARGDTSFVTHWMPIPAPACC